MLNNLKFQLALIILSLTAIMLKLVSTLYPIPSFYGYNSPQIILLFVSVVGGIPLIFQIIQKLLRRQFGADFLAAIAIITAILLNEYLAANLIILMLAGGQAFESFAVRKASSVLLSLANRMPDLAHRIVDNKVKDVPILDIHIGDTVVVYPHEICPVDGTVIEGHGFMDESYLTGEPYGVSKVPGTTVISGASNGAVLLVVMATSLPQDSRYAKIMKVMQEAEQHHPNLRRLGDQIGALFTPFALLIAVAVWYLTGDSIRFLSVLVIATPCPLLIAIPITIISAISLASSRGIIIKDPIVLERLPTCRTAIFDKTGTLTYGEPEMTELMVVGGLTRNIILRLCASLERYSKHPLASAILKAAKKENIELSEASSIAEPPGQGLTGFIEGKKIQITDRKHLMKTLPEEVAKLPSISPGLECSVVINDKLEALLRFRDSLRIEGKSFIGKLGPIHHFTRTMIVSGDRKEEVEYIAKQLGIQETFANQTPEQKVKIVRAETLKQPTLYIGDGINDAPAILSATVGLAFGGTSNITAEAGGAVILDNNLSRVDELLYISKAMRRVALQSALGGMLLSIIGMGFAGCGYITPVTGALLQEGIDVLAILNALRLSWHVYTPTMVIKKRKK